MEMIVCPNCNKLTGFKRVIGFGTFFAVLFTFGFWLFTIPFYPKRCITCGLTKSASVPWYQTWRVVVLALFCSRASCWCIPTRPDVDRSGSTFKDNKSGQTDECEAKAILIRQYPRYSI